MLDGVVVIFAPARDFHANAVAAEISLLGGTPVLLDVAAYPREWGIAASFDENGLAYRLVAPGRVVDHREVRGLWWRRPKQHEIAAEISDPRHVKFCRGEARSLLTGLLVSLGNRVVNPLAAQFAAAEKPHQLFVAAMVGLSIPATVITNVPSELLAFRAAVKGDIVYKILTGTDWRFTETRKLVDADIEQLSMLKYAPVIFQEYVEKVADVRVTIIDDALHSVECRPNQAGAAVDWRLDPTVAYLPYRLPEEVAARLIRLHRRLGLRYGAVDLAVTAAGDHVFLETNVSGQFMFAEIHAGYPLARLMAEALLNPPSIFQGDGMPEAKAMSTMSGRAAV